MRLEPLYRIRFTYTESWAVGLDGGWQHVLTLRRLADRREACEPHLTRHERTPGALPVEDLLPQDVCVPAVLGEFAQYVEVHPAQRERPAPVAVDPVVQPQG